MKVYIAYHAGVEHYTILGVYASHEGAQAHLDAYEPVFEAHPDDERHEWYVSSKHGDHTVHVGYASTREEAETLYAEHLRIAQDDEAFHLEWFGIDEHEVIE